MSITSRLKKSRNNWKNQAKDRGKQVRYKNAQLKRVKQERAEYKSKLKDVTQKLEEEREKRQKEQKEILPVKKEILIFISLRLFLTGHIGFRAISRVLGILQSFLGIIKPPCPQTIINWVIRYSLAKIWNYNPVPSICLANNKFVNGAIWIIDTSIALGSGKILAVLELKIDHYNNHDGAPALEDVNCVAVSVAESWTGKSIANFLKEVIGITGKPAAFLKDGGLDLMKAVRLLNEEGFSSFSIDDISHVIANLLKHEYSKHPSYDIFLSTCGQASKKLKQTVLAFLAPPKISTKARFMNIHRLIEWAEMVLQHSPAGRVSDDSPIAKLRIALGSLPECKGFIERFLRDAKPLLQCQEILKRNGLHWDTYQVCKELLKNIPENSRVRIGFVLWMEKQLITSELLGTGKIGLPISSDILEALFGLIKTHAAPILKDANRIALRLPALCGKLTESAAQKVMDISVKQQQEIEKKLMSLIKLRRAILPNPGSLTENFSTENYSNLSLTPVPKSEQNKDNIIEITEGYEKLNVPEKKGGKQCKSINDTFDEYYAEAI